MGGQERGDSGPGLPGGDSWPKRYPDCLVDIAG